MGKGTGKSSVVRRRKGLRRISGRVVLAVIASAGTASPCSSAAAVVVAGAGSRWYCCWAGMPSGSERALKDWSSWLEVTDWNLRVEDLLLFERSVYVIHSVIPNFALTPFFCDEGKKINEKKRGRGVEPLTQSNGDSTQRSS